MSVKRKMTVLGRAENPRCLTQGAPSINLPSSVD